MQFPENTRGTDEFVSLSRADYEIQGNDQMEISVYDSGTYVEFTEPGKGDLIITYGEGKTHTIIWNLHMSR